MLIGDLDLNAAPAVAALNQVDRKFSATTSALSSMASRLGPLIAGFITFGAVMNGFKQVMDLGGELSDISARTGESAGDLVILRQAFDNAGVGAEKVQPALMKLQDAIAGMNEEGKSTAGALKMLGTSAGELRNLSGIEQLERVGAGLRNLDQTTRAAVARDLFGKAGDDALSVLTDQEAFSTARDQAGRLAEVMDKNSAAFDTLGDTVGVAKIKTLEFFSGALSKFAPEATSIAAAFNSIDFVSIGEGFGEIGVQIGEALGPLIAFNKSLDSFAEFFMGSKPPPLSAFDKEGVARRRRLAGEDSLGEDTKKARTSAVVTGGLARLGGGSFGTGDPFIREAAQQTALLRSIDARLAERTPRGGADSRPVPV